MRAILLAGGAGARMRPFTEVLPKPLIPISGRPLLEILLRRLAYEGFEQATLCVGYLADLIVAYCGDGRRFGLQVDYVLEDQPLGTVGPLALIDDFDEPALVMNADILTALDFRALLAAHEQNDAPLTIACCERQVSFPVGTLEFDDDERLTSFEEKPTIVRWGNMGVYACSPEIREHIPGGRRFGFDDLVAALLAAGAAPCVFPFQGHWVDVASVEEGARAAEIFEKHRELFLPGACSSELHRTE